MTLNQKENSYKKQKPELNVYISSGGKIEICNRSISCSFFEKRVFKEKRKKLSNNREKKVSDPMSSFNRSKLKAKKIIKCNAWEWFDDKGIPFLPVFVTLTFKENVQDLNYANREFSRFIQRLNYELFNIKKAVLQYLGVVEFQKRGAIHYHIIFFNLPFITNIYEIWDQGRVDVKAVRTMKGLTDYLSKYMVKEAEDGRLSGKKRYFTSRKILRPIILRNYYVARMIKNALITRLKYQKSVNVEFLGDIDIYGYELNQNESILDFNLDHYTRITIESEINKQKEKTKL